MRLRSLVGPLVAVIGAVAVARRRRRPATDDIWVAAEPAGPPPASAMPDSTPAPAASVPSEETAATPEPAARSGSAKDRGVGSSIRMDLDQATAHHVEPVVEFLTYLQTRRGDGSHLMFVRRADLDEMAAASEEPVDDFLDRLDQLGVVVSTN